MKNFNFKTAANTKEAVKLASGRATFLAGGMTLLPAIKLRLAAYSDLINIKKIKNLSGIKVSSKSLKIETFVLNDKKPKLLFIPGGYAHGYKTLLADTRLIIFSTSTLTESIKDDYRYEAYYWNPWTIKER